VATKPISTDPVAEQTVRVSAPSDIRSIRPTIFTRAPWTAFARRAFSIGSLVVIDLVGLALALYTGLVLRELARGDTHPFWGILWNAERDWLPFLWLVTVLVFWRNGLYAPRELRTGVGRIVSSLVLVTVLTFAFSLGTGRHFTTYAIFPTVFVLATALIALFRASYDVVTRDIFRIAGVRRRALLVGEGTALAELPRLLGTARGGIEYEFVGECGPHPDDVDRCLDTGRVDELVVAYDGVDEHELAEIVEVAHRRGTKVRVAPKPTELILQRAEYVPGQGVPLFELRPPVIVGVDWAVKRVFDIGVSLVVVLLGLPVWLLIAGLVKLTSRGSVFYQDRRIGLQEHEFPMFKFRTMYANAASRQSEIESLNEADGPLFKIANDPRVTPVGRFLRKFSLDEVPQVLNVLRGEMSLVGPRPLPVRDYIQLEEWHRRRYLVLPGMTGLWQVSGRIALSFDDLVRLDFYYLENWSIWLDITILFKTLPAVLARRGAY
jgi:exopolysaccharide biosynthesis polyprenyl glycosylphosphotransferase